MALKTSLGRTRTAGPDSARGPHRPGSLQWAGRMLLLGVTDCFQTVSKKAPLPMERMAPSSVLLPNKSQKPISVSGFGEFALQDLAALLEKPV